MLAKGYFSGKMNFLILRERVGIGFRGCSFGASYVLFRVLAFWLKGTYVYFGGVRDYLCFLGAILCT